jgi:hypothetical protein
MIKFFRKIRKANLKEGKIANYLKYAFGEIILVVIGILIALEINNLNEERKSENIRQTYYKQMLDDIHIEKQYVQKQLDWLNKSIASYENYKEEVKDPDLKPIEIAEKLKKVELTFAIFHFNMKSINVLESTGDIKLMSENIRDELIDIKITEDYSIRQQNINDSQYENILMKAFSMGYQRLFDQHANFQGINVNPNITEIILTMESALALKNFTENDQVSSFNLLEKDLNELEESINSKLNP